MWQRRNRIRNRSAQRQLGMDELMIVNPARNGVEAVVLDDGVLRAVRRSKDTPVRAGRLVLGPDGEWYRRADLVAGPYLRRAAYRRRVRYF